MTAQRLGAVVSLMIALLLAGCGTTTVKSTAHTPLEQESDLIPEPRLLDVGVPVFEPGLDDLPDDGTQFPEVRNAEARYFADQLVSTLQRSGAWGPVRVIPSTETVVDLYVKGRILHSDGERMELDIRAVDSSGRVWLDRTYEEVVSQYAYETRRGNQGDPFQGIFNRIANDLLRLQQELPAERARELRRISELKFARQFAPEAFDDYLRETRKGELEVARLPAENDPLLKDIRRIRNRDFLYVDTLQEYYNAFSRRVDSPYQNWRASSYREVIAVRELKKQSNARLAGGVLAVAAGLLAAGSDDGSARLGGFMAAGAGGMLIKNALAKREEAQMHVQALSELGQSLEAEVEPRVIELEDRTVTLTGNVRMQYDQWRELLHEMYETERGEL